VRLRLTILGCGSSGGVPRVAQGWGACDPANPRNRRQRCSLLVERIGPDGVTRILIDTSPDLRAQLLAHDVRRIDAVLLTHAHADHLHGIDDVRPLVLQARQRLPLYMDAPTAADVRAKFGYVLETPPGSFYPPLFDEYRLEPGVPVTIAGAGGTIEALPIRFRHGDIDALGFRFGSTVYSPDLSGVPPDSEAALDGLDLWIIDALRYTRHISHISVTEALDLIARHGPKRAVLTNLHTDLDYETLAAKLPAHVIPAHDGLVLELKGDDIYVP
jgi:phosphoribosyl 1,2-cyclic phosphate phosphodiesterase